MKSRAVAGAAEALLAATMVGAPLAFGCVEPWSQALLEAACFILALLCCFLRAPPASVRAPLLGAAAVLAVGSLQLASAACGLGPSHGRIFTASARATREVALLWAAYAALLWSVPRIVYRAEAARRVARWVFVSGISVAVVGLAQRACGSQALYGLRRAGADAQPFGPYYNCDHAASMLAMSLLVGAAIVRSRGRTIGGEAMGVLPADHIRTQAGYGALVALVAVALAACGSSGAFLGLAAAVWLALLLGAGAAREPARRRRGFALLLASLALGLALTYVSARERVSAMGTLEGSTMDRLALYRSGLRMLSASPLFGWGLGCFGRVFAPFQDSAIVGVVDHIHNDWLELALDSGLVGSTLFALSLGSLLWTSARAFLRARSEEMQALVGGALAATVACAAHCLVDFPLHVPANGALFMCLMGFLSSSGAWADDVRRHRRPRPRLSFAMVPVLLVLAAVGLRPAVGAWYARQAELGRSEEKMARLRRAAAWDRRPEYLYRLGLECLDARAGAESPQTKPLESALRYAEAALREEPYHPEYLWLDASALWHLGREDEAAAALARARLYRFEAPAAVRPVSDVEELRARLATLRKLKLLPEERGPAAGG